MVTMELGPAVQARALPQAREVARCQGHGSPCGGRHPRPGTTASRASGARVTGIEGVVEVQGAAGVSLGLVASQRPGEDPRVTAWEGGGACGALAVRLRALWGSRRRSGMGMRTTLARTCRT